MDRQINRSQEESYIECELVPTQPFDTFTSRLMAKIKSENYDMIFFSHVFFNSGMAIKNLEEIVDAVQSNDTIIVIDGYHSFMALPINLSKLEDRIFLSWLL